MTISYLSRNSLIVHLNRSVTMVKGADSAPTLGPQGPPTTVVEATTRLEVIQTTDPDDTTLPPELQSQLVHLR